MTFYLPPAPPPTPSDLPTTMQKSTLPQNRVLKKGPSEDFAKNRRKTSSDFNDFLNFSPLDFQTFLRPCKSQLCSKPCASSNSQRTSSHDDFMLLLTLTNAAWKYNFDFENPFGSTKRTAAAKGQLILKRPFGVFKSPKNQRNFFQLISALASKKRSIQFNKIGTSALYH